jgi:lipopolysaccharide export system permease protein
MRDRYEKRGDIARIEPGQFQESANGERVFFIEKDASGKQAASSVFIAQHKNDKESITSARSGRVEDRNGEKFLVLENGQRLEKIANKPDLTVAAFKTYGAKVEGDDQSARSFVPSAAKSTLELVQTPTKAHLAEISWRAGLALTAINLVVIGLATAGVNPRVGRTANLGFAFMAFIVYFNLLILGKSWIETGQVHFGVYLLALHGGALILALLWLFKRHNNWVLRPTRALRVSGAAAKDAA